MAKKNRKNREIEKDDIFGSIQSNKDIKKTAKTLNNCIFASVGQDCDPSLKKAGRCLLTALIAYIIHYTVPSQQNMANVIRLLQAGQVDKDTDTYRAPLDTVFEEIHEIAPKSLADKQYTRFCMFEFTTRQSVLAFCGARLKVFGFSDRKSENDGTDKTTSSTTAMTDMEQLTTDAVVHTIVYGYARVSTYRQTKENSLEVQKERLQAAGAEVVYTDVFTGQKKERPQLQMLIENLQKGDTLIVTKLDQLGWSVSQASALITELLDSGVTIIVLNLGVLSNGSVSTLMRNVLLSFAQIERDMITERTQEGKAIARQKEGYKDGRPKKYNSAQLEHAMNLLQDHSYSQVVEMTGISRATLAREKSRRTAGERTQ